jgi:hypothetical protein
MGVTNDQRFAFGKKYAVSINSMTATACAIWYSFPLSRRNAIHKCQFETWKALRGVDTDNACYISPDSSRQSPQILPSERMPMQPSRMTVVRMVD